MDGDNTNKDNIDNIDNIEDTEGTETETENINGDTDFGEEEENAADIDEPSMPEVETTQEIADAEYFAPVAENRRVAEVIFDWIEIFASAFLTVILLFTFILRLVTVDGSSMEATLHDKDNLIISHLFFTPKQGDIVVIQVPNYKTPLIKRVIATEGQTIKFNFDEWTVEVEGEILDEPYVKRELGAMHNESISRENPVVTVAPGKIFVMGDNRNHSSDSRVSDIGQVDVKSVVGRVLIRVFPFDKFGIVSPNES